MELTPILAGPAAPPSEPEPKNVAEAAQQFEALLLGQMLENMRTSEEEQDPTSGTMWSLAAQQFAQILSKNGGLGLSKLIAAGLERKP